jgi:hypothetical protein
VYSHKASLRVGENRVTVASRASGGTGIEILDLDSGRQVKRTWQLERRCRRAEAQQQNGAQAVLLPE